MGKRKKRNPSQREPIGRAKSKILLYIAQKKECDYTEIREYLRSSLNIRNQSGIRKHINELLEQGLIRKETQGKGKSNLYYLDAEFTSFKKTFNFINENDLSIDFLKTAYVREIIKRNDFFLSGLINIIKTVVMEFIEIALDENKLNELLAEYKKEENDPKKVESMLSQIASMRAQIMDPGLQQDFDSLKNKTPEEIVDFTAENMNISKEFISGTVNLLFSDPLKIIGLISSSPSAMDYFLNLKNQNKMFLAVVFLRFFLSTSYFDPEKYALLLKYNKSPKVEDTAELSKIIHEISDMSNVLNDNPIVKVLESFFVFDTINGKIAENDYTKEALSKILLPQVKR